MIRRRAVRALLLAERSAEAAVLLIRTHFPDLDTDGWLTPGGGVEDGEDHVMALRRELAEETGFDLATGRLRARPVWTRRHGFTFHGEEYDQHETWYLVHVPEFEPTHVHNPASIELDLFREFRWWTPTKMAASDDLFIPRAFARHLDDLVRNGPPPALLDVGH